MNFDFDMHVHTFHSPCASAEMIVEDILRLAAERGITRIGFTDHYYTHLNPAFYDQIRAAVNETLAKRNVPIQVFYGCEAEVMAPGRTAGSQSLADRLDYVMVGATHFQNKGITDLPAGLDDAATARYFLQMFEYAVSFPWVDVMAHPFFAVPGICSPEVFRTLSDIDLLRAIELAKENKIAMEISRRVFNPGQLEFSARFYRLCKQVGLMFTMGSDAHALVDVGNVRILKPLIDDLGLAEADFWLPKSRTR